MKNIILNLSRKNKVIILSAVALILVASIVWAIVAFVVPPKVLSMDASGARVMLDCGAQVEFTVDDMYTMKSWSASNRESQKYTEGITAEMDLTAAIYHVFDGVISDRLIGNNEFSSVLVSVESANPQLYIYGVTGVNDIMSENMMEQIGCYGIAITEYDTEIQRMANLNNVTYAKAYICKMLEEDNEGLSAKKLMKLTFSEIVQVANNANEKNYMLLFLSELSQKNLEKVK